MLCKSYKGIANNEYWVRGWVRGCGWAGGGGCVRGWVGAGGCGLVGVGGWVWVGSGWVGGQL